MSNMVNDTLYTLTGPRWPDGPITWALATPDAGQRGTPYTFTSSISPDLANAVRGAFSDWAKVSGLTFQEVTPAPSGQASPDILLGLAQFGDHAATLGSTLYSYDAAEFRPPVKVLLEDPAERPLGPDPWGNLVYSASSSGFERLALHEIGHALGLGHSDDPGAVMYPKVTTAQESLAAPDIAGIQALYDSTASRLVSLTDPSTGKQSYAQSSAYVGPVTHVSREYLGSGNADIIGGTRFDDFINAGAGEDAVNGGGGNDVIDGGTGSNFLVGGLGNDVFFLDGRGNHAATWSTITDWSPGEQVSLWGWQDGISRSIWSESDGLGEYRGATLHADLDGDGTIDASVTWTGVTLGQLPASLGMDGLLWIK